MHRAPPSKRRRLNDSFDGPLWAGVNISPSSPSAVLPFPNAPSILSPSLSHSHRHQHQSSAQNQNQNQNHNHNQSPFFPTTSSSTSNTHPNVFSPGKSIDFLDPDIAEPFLSPFSTSVLDEFAQDPGFLESQEELRCLLFKTALSAAPTRVGSPAGGEEEGGAGEDRGDGDANGGEGEYTNSRSTGAGLVRDVLSSPKRIKYLKNYLGVVAPWLDMFDSQRVFGIKLPALARSCPALLYAILALSARQMERKNRVESSFDSLELYQEAIRSLTPLLQGRDPNVIATCVILCCLEMMSASAQDWRRHLEGCAALFEAFGINGFSGGVDQAVFWCYARMDLCGALIADGTESTLLKLSKWIPPTVPADDSAAIRTLFTASDDPDTHANYSVYLCSQTCDLITARTKYVELGEPNGCTSAVFRARWLCLWKDLQRWLEDRPPESRPVQTIEDVTATAADSSPFPQIFFTHWSAISANQLHHTSCVLLLTSRPPDGCLNNAIQPLWIAGRLLSGRREHQVLVRLIRGIEAATGWGVAWRIRDLEEVWGERVGR
ncbi:hypothetical protein K402DRAFT_444868 [Aulographum hederae CBS 113979]|uniref:Zn(II)2Cys6 transcription factor n=1 Tax=Aulographum hederae CBS 113979 TaxID=1176131 RepID=A0A6G1H8F8_9PEZI|nr:hypothetical protein K402DRAFT_444868 [Aulographum hederae CBS 113979]